MSNHEESVLVNRKEWFQSIGFDDTAAALLAYSNISPHGMKDLLDKSCPRDLAMRILMGTDANGLDDPTFVGRGITAMVYESDDDG